MDPPDPAPPAGFATTRWSLIEVLRQPDAGPRRAALEELCARTWYPLYAFARRRGLAADEATEATQDFFAEFLEREGFARAERERGRLRAFLLGSFRRHLAQRAEARRTRKRGGDALVLSLDVRTAEERYGLEPAHDLTPERLFEAAWARALLADVVESLRAEHEARGKGAWFAALEGELGGAATPPEVLAARLGTTPGAAKVAAHRLRTRYRERLRQAVLATLDDPRDLEPELSALRAAVALPPRDEEGHETP